MGEVHLIGMKELALKTKIVFLFPAVHRIAHARMLDVLHMNANLMGTTREQLAIDERVTIVIAAWLKTPQYGECGH